MRYFFFIWCSFFCLEKNQAQNFGLQLPVGTQSIEFPFEFHNNYIVVEVMFQRIYPAHFIFDTGAEHTILCKKDLSQLLGLKYEREFKIIGADFKKELKAYLTRGVFLQIKDSPLEAKQDILVLDEDYYRLDQSAGVAIHGIIGADLFQRYVVRIDYMSQKIRLTTAARFSPPRQHDAFDLEIIRGKPYLNSKIKTQPNDSLTKVKLLLDTGAGLALMFFSNTHPALTPPPGSAKGVLGMGLGGDIEGNIGRIDNLILNENIAFKSIICDFQETDVFSDSLYLSNRNGIIGAQILSRFDLIIDYVNQKLYLRPNRTYKQKILEDRSGLILLAQGTNFNHFYVNGIVLGSPAHWAGIQRGDIVVNINRFPTSLLSMTNISKRLSGATGKRVSITILRNGQKIKKSFLLKDLYTK